MVLIEPLDSTPAEVSATGRGNGWQSWPQGAEKEQKVGICSLITPFSR